MTLYKTSHNSRVSGLIWGQGGRGVVGVVGLLTVGEVESKIESPDSTSKGGISTFFDRQFPMLPR